MPNPGDGRGSGNVVNFPGIAQSGTGVAPGGGPPHDSDMEARVAVLEQIAKETKEAIAGLRTDLRADMADLRSEVRNLRSEQRTDYRWLLGIMLGMGGGLLAAMAKGFHWLG